MGKGKEVATVYHDHEVQTRVEDFLNDSHFPVFRLLQVNVESGLVTVSGKVDSFYEKQVAMTTCQNVVGVMAFVDQIEVNESAGEPHVQCDVDSVKTS